MAINIGCIVAVMPLAFGIVMTFHTGELSIIYAFNIALGSFSTFWWKQEIDYYQ